MASGQGRLFDIHFEIGLNPPPVSDFYAKVVLGQNAVIYESDGISPAAAIAKVALDLEQSGMWSVIAQNPSLSAWPNGNPPVKTTTPKHKIDPKAPKQKPMDLTQVPHPDCTGMCTSFDFFGKNKCKSMCGQRDGL